MGGIFDDFIPDDSEEPSKSYEGFPYPLDDKPDDPYLNQIFEDMGWSTWGDFASDKWMSSDDATDPMFYRPGFSSFIEDQIMNFYEIGILDFTEFYEDNDRYYAYVEGSG